MVSRQTSSGTRCFTPPLGRGFVPLPSSPTIAESSQDGQGAGHQCNTGLPKVAVCSVVANGTGDDGRASPPPSLYYNRILTTVDGSPLQPYLEPLVGVLISAKTMQSDTKIQL